MNIKISATTERHELPKLPYVFYEYLDKQFNTDYMLSKSQLKTNDELIGYMRGVRDVLTAIKVLTDNNDEE